MNELAVQGANDTNQSIDRDAINQELDALTEELNRISETTQFNKQNLLDGNFKDKNLQVGANAKQKIAISIDCMNADALGLGKETVKQGGNTPKKVVYNGMSFTYDKDDDVATNKANAISAFQKSISKKLVAKVILLLSMMILQDLSIIRLQLMEKRRDLQMLQRLEHLI